MYNNRIQKVCIHILGGHHTSKCAYRLYGSFQNILGKLGPQQVKRINTP